MACIGKCAQEGRRRSVSRSRFELVLRCLKMDTIEAAKAFGCSTSKIYGVRNGHDRIALDMALVLQERYGVPSKWLLALDEVAPRREWEAAHDDGD